MFVAMLVAYIPESYGKAASALNSINAKCTTASSVCTEVHVSVALGTRLPHWKFAERIKEVFVREFRRPYTCSSGITKICRFQHEVG